MTKGTRPDRMTGLENVLACYRLTRLLTEDEITRPAREKLVGACMDAGWSKAAYLVTCPYCVSPWAALVVFVLPRPLRRWLAVAGAVALAEDLRARGA